MFCRARAYKPVARFGTNYTKYRSLHKTKICRAENTTGPDPFATISVSEQTSNVYLDNVFPLKMGVWDIRQYLFRTSKDSLESKIKNAIPTKELPAEFKVKDVVARTKDGGAIVNFSFLSSDVTKNKVAEKIVHKIQEHVKSKNIVEPFTFQQVRAFLVKGEPFLEDILARYPSPRLRIEFQGDPINVEKLFHQLRPYGRIIDISLYPNPSAGKDPARYAIVQFTRVRFATSARNCLHGYKIDNTRLNILYERQMRTNVVKEWIVSHPRITVPVVAAVFAGVTYLVFDPIRTFFVASKITQRFNVQEYALYRWLRKETWDRLIPNDSLQASPEGSAWADDFEQTERLRTWLAESPETFIVISGHKGSGKSALVKSAIRDKKHTLYIDCEKIANARNQTEMTKSLAKQVGYFPIFTWMSSMSGLIDTVVAATTGQKANLSTSPDSKMKDVLETVAIALRETIPSEKEARLATKEEQETKLDKIKKAILHYNEKSHENEEKENVKHDENKLDYKSIPVVVIDNFMYRETSKNALLWEELSEWAALLIENSIAHVIFVSSNASVVKTLGKALRGRTFSNIMLSDAPPEKAMSFIRKQLGKDVDDPSFPEIIKAIGGRLTELEVLVQKMKMHMDAQSAFEDIVTRNLIEIRKYGFGDSSVDDNKIKWTPIQFWTVVKLLAEKKSINYDQLKWNDMFKGDDSSLKAMERAELITVTQKDGKY
ncbi:RNA12 protein-domain-containing protein [Sporodiniella umbellata]|nr:RNA12 protein-domain-containing protein [Sporodiniella umbellata]